MHDFGDHRQSAGPYNREEWSSQHDTYEARERHFEQPLDTLADRFTDSRQREAFSGKQSQPQRRSRDNGNNRWDFEDTNDIHMEDSGNSHEHCHRRQSRSRPRRSGSYHGSPRRQHHDDCLPSDFGETNISEDPFISSMLEGRYFDHRDDETPSEYHASEPRHTHLQADQGWEARDDDSVDSEVRRRVEKKMKDTRQQAAINDLLNGNMSFDDGCEDFYV